MRKLTFISVILVVSALLITPSFLAVADDDEGVPWFGLLPYLLTGGPPSGEPKAVFTVDPISGSAPLTVVFDATSSEDPDGLIETYEWDFDDGNSNTGIQASHTYDSAGEYTPELTVTDEDGKTDSYSNLTISVTSTNESPTANFTASTTSGTAPLDVSFDASGSSDLDGSIDSYSWDFGDGSTGSGETTTHTFNSAGDYTVELTVTDDDGASDSTTVNISVSSPSNEPPNASFTASPTSGEVPLEVSFDASGSYDPDGKVVSYEWDFDDDSRGTGESVDHTYDSSGTYNVELTVTDNDGSTDSTTTQLEVSSPIPTDIYVDVNNGNDQNGNGSLNNPYKTITKAVSKANISSTHNNIYLESGVYTSNSGEDFPLTLDDIDLIGNPDDPSQVEVSGKITVSNGEVTGIHFYQTLTVGKDALIQKNRFTGIGHYAVYIRDTSTIKDNTFKNNDTAIEGFPDNGPVKISNNTITENAVYAIAGGFNVKDVLIDSNQIEAPDGRGIYIWFDHENYEVVIRNNDISVEYRPINLSFDSKGEVLIEKNHASGQHHIVQITGESSATIDMGGGSLGSLGNNVFQQTESSDYYIVSHELPAYSGTIYAKNNTWKDSSGNEIQPLDVLEGPADTEHFYIKNKGNKIIFSEQ